jgi:membrane protein CcdC involved in cytochrome C biogenesis
MHSRFPLFILNSESFLDSVFCFTLLNSVFLIFTSEFWILNSVFFFNIPISLQLYSLAHIQP